MGNKKMFSTYFLSFSTNQTKIFTSARCKGHAVPLLVQWNTQAMGWVALDPPQINNSIIVHCIQDGTGLVLYSNNHVTTDKMNVKLR